MRIFLLRSSQILIDLSALAFAFALAFMVRFDWQIPTDMFGRLLLTVPYVVVLEYAVMVFFGVHRMSWRHVSLPDAATIVLAFLASATLLLLSRYGFAANAVRYPYLRHGVIPIGVILANFLLGAMAIVGVRVLRRLQGEQSEQKQKGTRAPVRTRTLLVGAGQYGALLARELLTRADSTILPVAFIDDDVSKHGTVMHGLKVVGSVADIGREAARFGATQVVIAIANATGKQIRDIQSTCETHGLPAKIVPGLSELAGGDVSVSRIRDVAIEDLLRREPVALDLAPIAQYLEGKVVLVSGAGGSIGSELCRQILRFRAAKILLLERSENALFQIHRELAPKARALGTELVPLVLDVGDKERVRDVFGRLGPQVIFHAAAHKHVPLMEWNPAEALRNNVLGTAKLATLAAEFDAQAFVMISTDKAVNPTSVMGATKRFAEMCVQSLADKHALAGGKTRFSTVRFGNVLGSAGSVIPIFREQIAAGGPVSVTHPDMRRYFMTIPEACQLVLQAGGLGQRGEIFVLDMGEPVRIVDLATDLIRLSGLRPGDDIQIEFTGMRPGEKLFEEIATDAEQADKTVYDKIFVGKTRAPEFAVVEEWMRKIEKVADRQQAVALLSACIPEFQPDDAKPAVNVNGIRAGATEAKTSSANANPMQTRPD